MNIINKVILFCGSYAMIIGIIGILFYLIPTFIAYSRKLDSKGWLLILNILIGWTLLGWFFCLFWAAFGKKIISVDSQNDCGTIYEVDKVDLLDSLPDRNVNSLLNILEDGMMGKIHRFEPEDIQSVIDEINNREMTLSEKNDFDNIMNTYFKDYFSTERHPRKQGRKKQRYNK